MSTIPAGYKQTEIGVIPEDWNVLPFKNISTMNGRIGWQGLKQNEFSDKNDEPFLITGMNFKDGKIRWDEVYHFPIQRYKEAINIQLRVDDVLMTKDGTIGKLLFVDDIPYPHIASLNSHLLVFRPKNNAYNSKFLYYQLHSTPFLKHIELTKSGTTFFGITQESVGKYNVYLPSISEQQLIAAALSDTDALIESLEKLIAKKRQIKEGITHKLLSPKEGWDVKKLAEVCDVRDGTHDSPKYYSDGVIFITSKNIVNGTIDFSDISFISKEDAILVNQRSKVDKGDILMSMIGTIGNAVLVDMEPNFCIKNVALLKPKKINGNFLIQLVNSSIFQNYLSEKLDGGIQKFISLGVLRELSISFPSIEEQTAIATILSDMDVAITALEERLEKTRTLKSGMMHELLTGRIRLI